MARQSNPLDSWDDESRLQQKLSMLRKTLLRENGWKQVFISKIADDLWMKSLLDGQTLIVSYDLALRIARVNDVIDIGEVTK